MRYLPSVCRDDVSESIVLAYHIPLSLMADDTHLIDNKISICYNYSSGVGAICIQNIIFL